LPLSEAAAIGRRQGAVNRQRKVFVALLGLLLALAWTALPVSAAPPTQGQDREAQADTLVVEGVKLYNVSRYQAALQKWPVDDAATADLMAGFYQYLREGYSKAEALRGAQMEMMDEKEEAYYWAGFSLVGDWGDEIERGDREGEIKATAVPTEAMAESTSTPEGKAVVTPTEAVVKPTVMPEGAGGGLCGGTAAVLMVGLVGVWLRGGWRLIADRLLDW
jgi:hypothetical protein